MGEPEKNFRPMVTPKYTELDMGIRQYGKRKKPSMKRRWEVHDYRKPGFYMITIETLDRRNILGKLDMKDNSVTVGQKFLSGSQIPFIRLSTIGQQVVKTWKKVCDGYTQIEPVLLQVMPDHIHGLLYVKEELPVHLGRIIGMFKHLSNKTAFKGLLEADKLKSAQDHVVFEGEKVRIWAEDYNDRVIKNNEQLKRTKAYIKDNPRRLWIKQHHHDYFAQLTIEAGGQSFNSIGNALLLNEDTLIPVHVSSRQTEAERQQQVQGLIEAAKQGAVLVSPFISKGEKEVEHALAELKLPYVKLLENGFDEFYKPAGKAFDACAEGRLLLLAPWAHHNERHAISREQCLALNQMAADICKTI